MFNWGRKDTEKCLETIQEKISASIDFEELKKEVEEKSEKAVKELYADQILFNLIWPEGSYEEAKAFLRKPDYGRNTLPIGVCRGYGGGGFDLDFNPWSLREAIMKYMDQV